MITVVTVFILIFLRAQASPPRWNGPVAGVWPFDPTPAGATALRVAAVQLTDFADGENRSAATETRARTAKVVQYLAKAAELGVEVAVFPEMSLVRYDAAALRAGTEAEMAAAEVAVARACAEHGIWAIIGLPQYFTPVARVPPSQLPSGCTVQKCWYNTALVIDDRGRRAYRQAKMHSAGPDGALGKWLDTFTIAKNVSAALQICADAYFPHVALLPVLVGARVLFALSSERSYGDDKYYSSVGTLYQGRAQEANIHLVQANTGAAVHAVPSRGHAGTFAGSHGNSQIISPGGRVLARARHTGEHIVYADIAIDSGPTTSGFADDNPLFREWLQRGARLLGKRMPIDVTSAPALQ